MENELLETVKRECKDITELFTSDFAEIDKLEKNPIVQRYKYLIKLRDQSIYNGFVSDDKILDYCLEQYVYGKVRETNDIWLLMIEGTVGEFEKLFGIQLLEKDKSKVAIFYKDIEDPTRTNLVLKEDQEEFEKAHRVVTGKEYIYDCEGRYYNLKHEFFTSCVKDGQENAVQMILKKYQKVN